jgi:hypothetical protein
LYLHFASRQKNALQMSNFAGTITACAKIA